MKFALLILLLSTTGWAKWSVSTYNIRNFDRDEDAGQTNLLELGKILTSVRSDVMAFPEIVNKKAFDSLVKKNLPGYDYKLSDCGGGGKQHLALAYDTKVFEFIKSVEDLTFSGNSNRCGPLRPVFLVTLRNKKDKTLYTFGAVHLKAGASDRDLTQRWKQYEKLAELSLRFRNDNLILLGDFNTTGYATRDQDFQKFEDFLGDSTLRSTSETLSCTSYWSGNAGGSVHLPSLLDHIVVQDKTFAAVEAVKVGAHCSRSECRPASPEDLGPSYQSVSDHCPVQVTFR